MQKGINKGESAGLELLLVVKHSQRRIEKLRMKTCVVKRLKAYLRGRYAKQHKIKIQRISRDKLWNLHNGLGGVVLKHQTCVERQNSPKAECFF